MFIITIIISPRIWIIVHYSEMLSYLSSASDGKTSSAKLESSAEISDSGSPGFSWDTEEASSLHASAAY